MELDSNEEIVSVPVPRRHLGVVYAALARAMNADASGPPAPLPAGEPVRPSWDWATEPLALERLRDELGASAAFAMMDLTSERPGEWVSFHEIVKRAGRTEGEARADLGTLTKLVRKTIGEGASWPAEWQFAGEEGAQYRMTPEVADAWRRSGSSLSDRIRAHVIHTHVDPARGKGEQRIVLRAGDTQREMDLRNRVPAVCSALRSRQFAEEAGVYLEDSSGPYLGPNTTLTFRLD
jgi:hypothetical protein